MLCEFNASKGNSLKFEYVYIYMYIIILNSKTKFITFTVCLSNNNKTCQKYF